MRYVLLNRFLCVSALFLFLSCSSENPSKTETNKPWKENNGTISRQVESPVTLNSQPFSLAITPVNASCNSTLQVIAQGFQISDATIEWLLNGHPTINHNTSHFKASETKKGDKIQVKATIQGKELLSNIIEIKNAPPEIIRVKILPEIFKPGDVLNVEISANDADGDEVTVVCEWVKNGEPAGNGRRLEVPLKRGDKIAVRITPFDGEINGSTVILNREIKNMPPMIIEDSRFYFDGKLYTYQIKAADADGDPLTFSLKAAPADMTINASTGLIQWTPPKNFNVKTPVTVSVADGNGGEASYTFNVILASQ